MAQTAHTVQGSWWPDFADRLGDRCGPTTPAPDQLGGGVLHPLTPAPGTYIFEK